MVTAWLQASSGSNLAIISISRFVRGFARSACLLVYVAHRPSRRYGAGSSWRDGVRSDGLKSNPTNGRAYGPFIPLSYVMDYPGGL